MPDTHQNSLKCKVLSCSFCSVNSVFAPNRYWRWQREGIWQRLIISSLGLRRYRRCGCFGDTCSHCGRLSAQNGNGRAPSARRHSLSARVRSGCSPCGKRPSPPRRWAEADAAGWSECDQPTARTARGPVPPQCTASVPSEPVILPACPWIWTCRHCPSIVNESYATSWTAGVDFTHKQTNEQTNTSTQNNNGHGAEIKRRISNSVA